MGSEEAEWAAVPYNYAEETRRLHGDRIAEDIARRVLDTTDALGYIHQVGAAAGHNTVGRLHEIAAPTLVVHGRITDSVGGYTDYTTGISINDVAPTPSITPPSPLVAGTAGTFTASATSPSTADTKAGFTYAWNFGDGDSCRNISAPRNWVRLALNGPEGQQ